MWGGVNNSYHKLQLCKILKYIGRLLKKNYIPTFKS